MASAAAERQDHPEEEEDLVSLPRFRGDDVDPNIELASFASGDPSRALFLAGNFFTGAHTDNPSYFTRAGSTLLLRSVCWLAVGATIPRVPAGDWEAILLVKIADAGHINFVADWKVGVGVGHARNWSGGGVESTWDDVCQRALDQTGVRPIMFRNVKSNDRGGASLGNGLLRRCGGRWAKLSFGTLRLPEKEEEGSRACYDVRFEMGGGNSGWCSGIEFGGFELRACGLSWGQKRLLELCRLGKAAPREERRGAEEEGGSTAPSTSAVAAAAAAGRCYLQEVAPVILTLIVQFLHTPLPSEAALASNVVRRFNYQDK